MAIPICLPARVVRRGGLEPPITRVICDETLFYATLMVQAMGNAPTRIFRLKGGCPSIVASLAFLLLVTPVGFAPTTARLKGECYIYMSFGAVINPACKWSHVSELRRPIKFTKLAHR